MLLNQGFDAGLGRGVGFALRGFIDIAADGARDVGRGEHFQRFLGRALAHLLLLLGRNARVFRYAFHAGFAERTDKFAVEFFFNGCFLPVAGRQQEEGGQ